MLGTVFGVATSLGFGVLQISAAWASWRSQTRVRRWRSGSSSASRPSPRCRSPRASGAA
ncbi:hypothetical protein NKG05_18355 [Oerskovia sp. M15]